jgi:uncharacterized membrane-anchored protein
MNAMTTRALIALGALLIFGGVNYSIFHKENIKRNGEVIYMELAPVDPRSLMQGDYMILNFGLAREIESGLNIRAPQRWRPTDAPTLPPDAPREGETRMANVALDEIGVAHYRVAAEEKSIKLRYRIRNGRVWLGTNGFFFEEGKAANYDKARYGEFRLDRKSGEAVLVGLVNDRFEPL